jgi:enolase
LREALDAIMKAIEEKGYENDCVLGLDATASSFYDKKRAKYILMGKEKTREDMIQCYKDLVSTYPILSIEDPFDENDFEGFARITKELNIQIVGDDIFVTNVNA